MQGKIRTIIIALLILLALSGLGLIFAPKYTGWCQTVQLAQVVVTFRDQLDQLEQMQLPSTDPTGSLVDPTEPEPTGPAIYPELLAAMRDYNRLIYSTGQADLVDAWSYQADVFDLSDYGIIDGVAGVISIPKIGLEMPLYLGATYEHMAIGFAQLSQTSMPIGGINTNCVVVGHRGWRGAPYMRYADQLEIGDSVILQNLWETLEYRVCEIQVISPNEIDKILIQPGRDLLTLFTCTPYGVGSHRLLIVCERY